MERNCRITFFSPLLLSFFGLPEPAELEVHDACGAAEAEDRDNVEDESRSALSVASSAAFVTEPIAPSHRIINGDVSDGDARLGAAVATEGGLSREGAEDGVEKQRKKEATPIRKSLVASSWLALTLDETKEAHGARQY